MDNKILLLVFVGYILVVSIFTFMLYGIDKKLAIKNKDRIKEKTLLRASVYGGAIGAFIGRIVFKHKTDKSYFSITIVLSLLSNLAILGLLIYLNVR